MTGTFWGNAVWHVLVFKKGQDERALCGSAEKEFK